MLYSKLLCWKCVVPNHALRVVRCEPRFDEHLLHSGILPTLLPITPSRAKAMEVNSLWFHLGQCAQLVFEVEPPQCEALQYLPIPGCAVASVQNQTQQLLVQLQRKRLALPPILNFHPLI